MKNVLITGGAGFIGSNLARHIVQKYGTSCSITIMDNLSTGRCENIKGVPATFIRGDINDKILLSNAVKGKDVVFHLAARNVIVGNEKPYDDIETNIIGTYRVFETCSQQNVERIVYASTSSIYGNASRLPALETDRPQFLNNYSVSKFAGESYANCFWERQELPVTIVRYTNVFGYNQWPDNPYSGVIGKFIGCALRNEPLSVHGDGEQTRDFTFIDDACEATLLAATRPRAVGQVYNVGTGVETSVNKLAERIIALAGSRSKIRHVEKRDIDNIRRRVLGIEKIRTELRFFPRFTVDDGLREAIRWERERQAAVGEGQPGGGAVP